MGCGPQEEFRACADVAITDRSGHASSEEDDTDDNDVDTSKLFYFNFKLILCTLI